MAYAASSAEATTTLVAGRPCAALCRRSIPAATAYGSCPLNETECSEDGLGTSPTRIACAPPTAPEPVGASRRSAPVVADGNEELPESRIGALTGPDIRTEDAIAACQLSVGAITTEGGCVLDPAEGYTASATAAASAVGSAPATRVVFLVTSHG